MGSLLDRVGDQWEGNLCWTLDADILLAAAEGPPAPVSGSPLQLVASVSLGGAGLVALNRDGEILGYGRGQPPGQLSVCPEGQEFIGHAGGNQVRTWSFASLYGHLMEGLVSGVADRLDKLAATTEVVPDTEVRDLRR